MDIDFTTDIKQEVKKAIENKETLDGLSQRLYKRLIREIKSFSDKIKIHESPDMALIAYKGRYYYELGYEKRGLELDKAINKELNALEPTTPPDSPIKQVAVGEGLQEPQKPIQTISKDTIL